MCRRSIDLEELFKGDDTMSQSRLDEIDANVEKAILKIKKDRAKKKDYNLHVSLTYIDYFGSNFSFGKLMQILEIKNKDKQLKAIDFLFEKDYLIYSNFVPVLTKKGLETLEKFNIQYGEITMFKQNKDLLKVVEVPTGQILIIQGEDGLIECLSLADYGQIVNLKADFLGLNNVITQVKHVEPMSLEEKWVITISTQYGCSMKCKFCDVPKVGPGKNISYNDLKKQIITVLDQHKEVKQVKRLNLHYARMGEPTWNPAVLELSRNLKDILSSRTDQHKIHPVISTMLPKNNSNLKEFITEWIRIKNDVFDGNAGLQFSINSTNDEERNTMFSGNALNLNEIPNYVPDLTGLKGRKIILNFAVANYEIDPNKLLKYFSPEYYLIKLTPMHKTNSAANNNIETDGDYTTIYPYQEHEENLKKAGYDVLVFIASEEEDKSRITCGNAILSDGKTNYDN